MFTTTVNLARSFNVTPFEIMAQDCDEVIMLINYFLEKAARGDDNSERRGKNQKDDQQMIKVDNKTATGGWW